MSRNAVDRGKQKRKQQFKEVKVKRMEDKAKSNKEQGFNAPSPKSVNAYVNGDYKKYASNKSYGYKMNGISEDQRNKLLAPGEIKYREWHQPERTKQVVMGTNNPDSNKFKDHLNTGRLDGLRVAKNNQRKGTPIKNAGQYLWGGAKDFVVDPLVDAMKIVDRVEGQVSSGLGATLQQTANVFDGIATGKKNLGLEKDFIKNQMKKSVEESNKTGWGRGIYDVLKEEVIDKKNIELDRTGEVMLGLGSLGLEVANPIELVSSGGKLAKSVLKGNKPLNMVSESTNYIPKDFMKNLDNLPPHLKKYEDAILETANKHVESKRLNKELAQQTKEGARLDNAFKNAMDKPEPIKPIVKKVAQDKPQLGNFLQELDSNYMDMISKDVREDVMPSYLSRSQYNKQMKKPNNMEHWSVFDELDTSTNYDSKQTHIPGTIRGKVTKTNDGYKPNLLNQLEETNQIDNTIDGQTNMFSLFDERGGDYSKVKQTPLLQRKEKFMNYLGDTTNRNRTQDFLELSNKLDGRILKNKKGITKIENKDEIIDHINENIFNSDVISKSVSDRDIVNFIKNELEYSKMYDEFTGLSSGRIKPNRANHYNEIKMKLSEIESKRNWGISQLTDDFYSDKMKDVRKKYGASVSEMRKSLDNLKRSDYSGALNVEERSIRIKELESKIKDATTYRNKINDMDNNEWSKYFLKKETNEMLGDMDNTPQRNTRQIGENFESNKQKIDKAHEDNTQNEIWNFVQADNGGKSMKYYDKVIDNIEKDLSTLDDTISNNKLDLDLENLIANTSKQKKLRTQLEQAKNNRKKLINDFNALKNNPDRDVIIETHKTKASNNIISQKQGQLKKQEKERLNQLREKIGTKFVGKFDATTYQKNGIKNLNTIPQVAEIKRNMAKIIQNHSQRLISDDEYKMLIKDQFKRMDDGNVPRDFYANDMMEYRKLQDSIFKKRSDLQKGKVTNVEKTPLDEAFGELDNEPFVEMDITHLSRRLKKAKSTDELDEIEKQASSWFLGGLDDIDVKNVKNENTIQKEVVSYKERREKEREKIAKLYGVETDGKGNLTKAEQNEFKRMGIDPRQEPPREKPKNMPSKVYKKWLTAWKKGVTVYNPGWHLQNFFQNKTQNYISMGNKAFAPQTDARGVLKAMDGKKHKNKSLVVEQNGLKQIMNYDEIANLAKEHNVIDNGFIENNSGNFIDRSKLMKSLNNNEKTARLHHFINKIQEGASPEDAVKSVNKYLYDYSDINDGERFISDYIDPFYAFHKNNARMLGQSVFEQPSRMNSLNKGIQSLGKTGEEEFDPDYDKLDAPDMTMIDKVNGGTYDYKYKQSMIPEIKNALPMNWEETEYKLNPLLKVALQMANKEGNFGNKVVEDDEAKWGEITKSDRAKEIIMELNPIMPTLVNTLDKTNKKQMSVDDGKISQELADKQKLNEWLKYLTGHKGNWYRREQ